MSPAVGQIFIKNGSFYQDECQKSLMIKILTNIDVGIYLYLLIQHLQTFLLFLYDFSKIKYKVNGPRGLN